MAETGQLIDDEERANRQVALDQLMELMRPAVQADGGDLVVTDVDFDAGIVEVQLQGACGSCAISGLTLQGGVERLMRCLLYTSALWAGSWCHAVPALEAGRLVAPEGGVLEETESELAVAGCPSDVVDDAECDLAGERRIA